MAKSKTQSYLSLLLLLSLLNIGAAVAVFGFYRVTEQGMRIMIRSTALIAAVLFCISFSASAIYYFLPGKFSALLLRLRPQIGLGFSVFHSFHLLFLLWLQQSIHPVFTLAKTSSLAAGVVAYFFLWAMMLTSFPEIRSRFSSRNWKLLHTFGGYWIWGVFFSQYSKKIMNHDSRYVLFGLVLSVLLLRIAKLIAQRIKLPRSTDGDV